MIKVGETGGTTCGKSQRSQVGTQGKGNADVKEQGHLKSSAVVL